MQVITTDRKENNKIAIIEMDDFRAIPVIFVPGIMGTNLMEKVNDTSNPATVWRYDGPASLLGWSVIGSGPQERKRLLHPDRVSIDDRGIIPMSASVLKELTSVSQNYPSDPTDKEAVKQYQQDLVAIAEKHAPDEKLFGSRRSRGWGEVACASYGSFLDSLQNALFRDRPLRGQPVSEFYQSLLSATLGLEHGPDTLDEKCLEVLWLYQFPVHAVGYNWLGSNKLSAERLSQKVDEIIQHYRNQDMLCHKVILVTHSMGGLVARYYSECLSTPGRDKIYGIVHGVMPATGAAAAYTRMKRGTENPESSAVGFIASHILGRNAAEMTAICGQSAGALELLPSPHYAQDWLVIKDRHGKEQTLPGPDPYATLYLNRNNWWKLIDENLLNPVNTSMNKVQMERDWAVYKNLLRTVKTFHEKLGERFHPCTYAFYGRVTGAEIAPTYRTQQVARWDGRLAGGRPGAYPAQARFSDGRLDLGEVSHFRTIKEEFTEKEKTWEVRQYNQPIYSWLGQRFTLGDACENGDGTVPVCSGQIDASLLQEQLALNVAHESAYQNPTAQDFTLRAIIKIAQQANQKDDPMAFID